MLQFIQFMPRALAPTLLPFRFGEGLQSCQRVSGQLLHQLRESKPHALAHGVRQGEMRALRHLTYLYHQIFGNRQRVRFTCHGRILHRTEPFSRLFLRARLARCINTVTMSLVGMARCAVTVAERSVRRRNERSGSHGFGQCFPPAGTRVGTSQRDVPTFPGKNGVERRPAWQLSQPTDAGVFRYQRLAHVGAGRCRRYELGIFSRPGMALASSRVRPLSDSKSKMT